MSSALPLSGHASLSKQIGRKRSAERQHSTALLRLNILETENCQRERFKFKGQVSKCIVEQPLFDGQQLVKQENAITHSVSENKINQNDYTTEKRIRSDDSSSPYEARGIFTE